MAVKVALLGQIPVGCHLRVEEVVRCFDGAAGEVVVVVVVVARVVRSPVPSGLTGTLLPDERHNRPGAPERR